MERLQGLAASQGIAIGRARRLVDRLVAAERRIEAHAEPHELRRLASALAAADERLGDASRGFEAAGEHDGHAIVNAQRMILNSNEINEGAQTLIRRDRLDAAFAVRRVVEALVAQLERTSDPYLRERGADVDDVGQSLLRALIGSGGHLPSKLSSAPGDIGIAWSVSAIDAFRLPTLRLAGLVTARGGVTSHAAIAVRAHGIPYVAAVHDVLESVREGTLVIVDGSAGVVIVDPDEDTRRAYEARAHGRAPVRTSAARRPSTSDGVEISVGANVDRLSDVERVIAAGGDSVGLLRTELLYLDRADLPSEDEQHRDAVAAIVALQGRVATFRTLDIGGDKLPLAIKMPVSVNPSLGLRGIRFSAVRPDIFRLQLRALYRASAAGPMRIMFPMISNVRELRDAVATCAVVRDELTREGFELAANVPLGAMIETPSAALVVDHLADACDFFSIGTNDLIQYAFAADRENDDVGYLYHPLDPAVLRLVELAVVAAGRAGKPIAMCGDMAGDPALTPVLLGLGVTSLSMAPRHIPAVRAAVEAVSLQDCRRLVRQALALGSADEVEALVAREGVAAAA